MTEDERRMRRQELLLYQDKLEGVLHGMDKPSFAWHVAEKEAARGWLIATLELVKTEIMGLSGVGGDVEGEIEALAQADPLYKTNRLAALQRAARAVARKHEQSGREQGGAG